MKRRIRSSSHVGAGVHGTSCQLVCLALLVWAVGVYCLTAQEAGRKSDPEALSIFPLGAGPGTVNAEILGKSLEGAYGVWSSSAGISGQVQSVRSVDLTEFKKGAQGEPTKVTRGHRVHLSLQVGSNLTPGVVLLRILTSTGISNALSFIVHDEPVVDETTGAHGSSAQAQMVRIPAIVSGQISKPGEVDFYAVNAERDQELVFEMVSKPVGVPASVSGGFSTAISLFQPSGSWFDDYQVSRLAYSDESVPGMPPMHSLLRYKVSKAGLYVVQAASFSNKGGPEFSYQLRIAPATKVTLLDRFRAAQSSSAQLQWQERTFTRRLDVDRLNRLWGRTVQAKTHVAEREANILSEAPEVSSESPPREPGQLASKSEGSLAFFLEREAKELTRAGKCLSVPVLIEGSIGQPGEIDSFRLRIEKGQALAFELETPLTAPPLFNPELVVLDESGRECLSNVFRRIARNFTFYAKTIQPKTVFTFELGGEYTFLIRDITTQVGNASCQYRVLIRRQVPHVGEIRSSVDRLNLVRGSSKRLNVATDQEEGFSGAVAIAVENLPIGVTAWPATEVKPDQGTNPDEGPKERFVAKADTATILLAAQPDAPVTERPELIRIVARPMINGVLGSPLRSVELPIMVVPAQVTANQPD